MTRAFVETWNFGANGVAGVSAGHLDMFGRLECVWKSMTNALVRGTLVVVACAGHTDTDAFIVSVVDDIRL